MHTFLRNSNRNLNLAYNARSREQRQRFSGTENCFPLYFLTKDTKEDQEGRIAKQGLGGRYLGLKVNEGIQLFSPPLPHLFDPKVGLLSYLWFSFSTAPSR